MTNEPWNESLLDKNGAAYRNLRSEVANDLVQIICSRPEFPNCQVDEMNFSPYSQNIYLSRFNKYDLTKDYLLYEPLKTLVDFSILVAGQISDEELVEEYNKAFEQDFDDLELLIISPADAALKEKITLSNLGDKPIDGIIVNINSDL